jgi:hypothetical protein
MASRPTRRSVATLLALLILAGVGPAAAPAGPPSPADLARWVVDANGADAAVSADAVTHLRAAGPAGLAALMAADQPAIRAHAQGNVDATWTQQSSALDAVAGQWDAWAAGLYWYTDWPTAAAAARAAGKPVLSLRLLGKLTDEYSCANSRFFRTVLYADPAVAQLLRERFVLCWQMVRPAPVITIDYGDGRVIRRTITGNSIHYVLNADGTVVDGLPGLLAPKVFIAELTRAAEAADRAASLLAADRASFLADWHARRERAIDAALSSDLAHLGLRPGSRLSDADWQRLANLHPSDASLSPSSLTMMTIRQTGAPPAAVAARVAMSKMVVENPMLAMVGEFRRSLALDTVHNEYDLHRRLHAMLAEPTTATTLSTNVAALNDRVYAELFLTPNSDPWLGLDPGDGYTALPGGGLVRADR